MTTCVIIIHLEQFKQMMDLWPFTKEELKCVVSLYTLQQHITMANSLQLSSSTASSIFDKQPAKLTQRDVLIIALL